MPNQLKPLRAMFGALLLALVAVATVQAYSGQVAATVEASGPSGQQACGTPIAITALIMDVAGSPIEGQPVEWTLQSGDVPGDMILDPTTITDSSGIATGRAEFACVPHSVTIGIQADDVFGSAVLGITGVGLPRTDTAPQTPLLGIVLAALAVLIGSGLMLRRFALDRP